MKKLILISLLVGLLALFQAPMTSSAASIDFNPTSPQGVTSGDTLNVDVVVSGLGGQIVSAYDLDVVYNTSFLKPAVTAVTFGPWLGDPLSLQSVNLSSGLIDFAEVSLLSDVNLQALQAGPGILTLATLNFDVIGTGSADYAFSWTPGNDVKGLNNEPIIPGGKVPEPATMLLIGSGLLGLVGLRRKFKK